MAIDIDEQLLAVLACPADHHAPLRAGTPVDPGANMLTCTECGRTFPIRDGIPVLLLGASDGAADGASGGIVGGSPAGSQ